MPTGLEKAVAAAGWRRMRRKNRQPAIMGCLPKPSFATRVPMLAEHICPLRFFGVPDGERPCLAETGIGGFEYLPEKPGRISAHFTGNRIRHILAILFAFRGIISGFLALSSQIYPR